MYCLAILSLIPFLANGLPSVKGYPWNGPIKHIPMYDSILPHGTPVLKFCAGKPSGFHSMGPCKNYHAVCNHHDELTVLQCPKDQVYRYEEGSCVDLSDEPRCDEIAYAGDHPTCQQSPDIELLESEPCSHKYGVCFAEMYYTTDCLAENEVFSDQHGTCIPTHENPSCSSNLDNRSRKIMQFEPLTSMCDGLAGTDHKIYFGPCNHKYMHCDQDGTTMTVQCEKGHVADADGDSDDCVPESESSMCPQNWDQGRGDAILVDQMNAILKTIDYCESKQNGLYRMDIDWGSICKREAIFCFKGQATFHLCPPGYDLGENGWCKIGRECPVDQSVWRALFVQSFGIDAQICKKIETDHVQVQTYGRCPNFHSRCHFGQFSIETCENPGHVFDVYSNECRQPIEGDQCDSTKITKPNRCENPEQESKLVATGQCEKEFLACLNGWDTKFSCENVDHAFNEEKERCVPKADHPNCPEYNPNEPEPEPEPESTTAPAPPTELTCQGDGGFHEHKDCTKYYRCAHGRLVEMECGPGTAWDQAILTCNHKHEVKRCENGGDKKVNV